MATKIFKNSNSSVSFKRAMRKVGICLLLILKVMVRLPFLLLIWLFTIVFLNRLSLYILGLICPKWIIPAMEEYCFSGLRKFCMDDYWRSVAEPTFNRLPWYGRRWLLLQDGQAGFSNAEVKDQIRLFKEMNPDQRREIRWALKSQTKKVLWEEMPEMRAQLIGLGMQINCQQFSDIIYPLDEKAFAAYRREHATLSAEFLVVMRDCLDRASQQDPQQAGTNENKRFLYDTLWEHITLYGAPESLLKDLGGCTPYVFDCVKNALNVYADRQTVLKYKDRTGDCMGEWRQYCDYLNKSQKQMSLEAQVLMDKEEYKLYAAAGLKLNEEAVKYFIFKGDMDFVAEILRHEVIAMTPEMEMLLYSRPMIYRLYTKAVAARKESTL